MRAGGLQGGGFDCGSKQLSAPWSPSFGTFLGEARKVHTVPRGLHKKTWGAETPHAPRFGRNASIYDLHEKAGGLPLQTVTAPNIRRLSKQGREVCKQERKLTSRLKNVGPKRHATHQAGNINNWCHCKEQSNVAISRIFAPAGD